MELEGSFRNRSPVHSAVREKNILQQRAEVKQREQIRRADGQDNPVVKEASWEKDSEESLSIQPEAMN